MGIRHAESEAMAPDAAAAGRLSLFFGELRCCRHWPAVAEMLLTDNGSVNHATLNG